MKRVISIAMVLFGFNMLVTGVLNIFPPFDTVFFPSHVVNSIVFGVLAIIHVCLNWGKIVRYFNRLRWWWLLVGVGFVGVVWSVVVMPMLYLTGVW